MAARSPLAAKVSGLSGLSKLPGLDDGQFELWASLLQQRTGIEWPISRKSFLETRLRLRMRELGFDQYQQFHDYLLGSGDGEWAILVDRLTIHETRFFRHLPTFRLIRDQLLSKDAKDNSRFSAPVELFAWSIGCATGEEPYTLAIVLNEYFRALGRPHDFRILASDISFPALLQGKRGIYPRHRLKEIPLALRIRYFKPVAPGDFQVSAELRKRVQFVQANALRTGHTTMDSMDLILCQNLLMYFSREQRIEILDQLVGHLGSGGLMILGPGEILGWSHPEMERVAYQHTLAFRHV